MSSEVTLFDLPSRAPCKTWSLNPWKTRMLLNYKGIPYKTQWVEYPDIKPLLQGHVSPNPKGMEYTIPAVLLADGSYMQDSRKIADRLEKDYPSPSVHLNHPVLAEIEAIIPKIQEPIRPVFVPKVPKRLLNEASQPYWYRTREQSMGGNLDEIERERGGDSAWEVAAPAVQQATKLLKSTEGPFFAGEQVTYADFVWASFVIFLQRIGDDLLDKLLEVSGDAEVHKAHLKACEPWLTRNDH